VNCPHTGQALREILGGRAFQNEQGVIYVKGTRSLDYGADYFLTEYEKQYGKTYLQDEPNLRRLAARRLEDLSRVAPPPASLFEIGAACGFFLDEARICGYDVHGLEISEFASNHARSLGLDVQTASFPTATNKQYDVVAAFFVLEHFPDQKSAFESVSKMIRPGGIFAAALPSSHGPTLKYSPDDWIRTHPEDHFADYSPRSLAKILPLYGMELINARPASFHPSRARGILRWPPLYRLYARANSFGDTMEILARKK